MTIEQLRQKMQQLLEDNKGPVVVREEDSAFYAVYLYVTIFDYKVADFGGGFRDLRDAVEWAERTKMRFEIDLRGRLMKHGYYKREE